ncbi:MAG: type VI secretion system tube protein Hcp [Rhodospirillales bacterium]|nr:type VI secretion system tube protein Hcp [Rhodospirillales bacterium]
MALYMKYGSIDGNVETVGYDKWIQVNSFQWGVGRGISSPMGTSEDREASHPSVSEITVTKEMDVATNKLLEDALGGAMNTKVEIAYVTTGKNEVKEFLRYILTNTAVSGYSVSSGGDRPSESLSLNFTKVEIKYTALNVDESGNPASTTYDLAKLKLNG